MHELTNVLLASSVRYWVNGTYAFDFSVCRLTCFNDCCFIERSLSKMKPRLRTVPGNSVTIGIAEKDCLWVWQGRVDRGAG